ncbi:hypothetical protein L6258_01160 [Candidatus Parcubacteria bacterium]|nr:hypothetical protein [Candidatus Parcubacteria bacterium]
MELFAQGKIYLAITALIILSALAALWVQAGGRGSWTETTRWPQLIPTYTLSLRTTRAVIPAGEAEEVTLVLSTRDLSQLNGLSIRLLTNLPEGAITALEPNQELVQAGVSFPVQKVLADPATGQVTIELAAFAFPKKNLEMASPVTVATFQVKSAAPQKVQSEFDLSVTKITFWDQPSVELELLGKELEIR